MLFGNHLRLGIRLVVWLRLGLCNQILIRYIVVICGVYDFVAVLTWEPGSGDASNLIGWSHSHKSTTAQASL